MTCVSMMRTVAIIAVAMVFWIRVAESIAPDIHVSRTTLLVVLSMMSLALAIPLRRWRHALPLSALFAGAIAVGSLTMAM